MTAADLHALDAASNAIILALLRDRDSYRLCYLAALDKLSEQQHTIARLRDERDEARDEIRRYARRVFNAE